MEEQADAGQGSCRGAWGYQSLEVELHVQQFTVCMDNLVLFTFLWVSQGSDEHCFVPLERVGKVLEQFGGL